MMEGDNMDILIYNEIPKGWEILNGAQTAPKGYAWIWNKKSRFGASKDFQHGLLKIIYDNVE